MPNDEIDRMLATNAGQKRYYEVASGTKTSVVNGMATNLWRRLRQRAFDALPANYSSSIVDVHREWIGDVSGKKVLELGVGAGSPFSVEFADRAREYVAIDLSEARTHQLRRRLADFPKARIYTTDFLGTEFDEDGFDLIYAIGVLHHFEHFEAFLDVVIAKLASGGRVITRDPVETWLPIRLLRAAYRPFQTDADWEYPFGRRAIGAIEARFEVLDRKALLNRAKWATLAGVVAPRLGARLARRWHEADIRALTTDDDIRGSLQVSYHLRRRGAPDDG